jgi:hypothetical protein
MPGPLAPAAGALAVPIGVIGGVTITLEMVLVATIGAVAVDGIFKSAKEFSGVEVRPSEVINNLLQSEQLNGMFAKGKVSAEQIANLQAWTDRPSENRLSLNTSSSWVSADAKQTDTVRGLKKMGYREISPSDKGISSGVIQGLFERTDSRTNKKTYAVIDYNGQVLPYNMAKKEAVRPSLTLSKTPASSQKKMVPVKSAATTTPALSPSSLPKSANKRSTPTPITTAKPGYMASAPIASPSTYSKPKTKRANGATRVTSAQGVNGFTQPSPTSKPSKPMAIGTPTIVQAPAFDVPWGKEGKTTVPTSVLAIKPTDGTSLQGSGPTQGKPVSPASEGGKDKDSETQQPGATKPPKTPTVAPGASGQKTEPANVQPSNPNNSSSNQQPPSQPPGKEPLEVSLVTPKKSLTEKFALPVFFTLGTIVGNAISKVFDIMTVKVAKPVIHEAAAQQNIEISDKPGELSENLKSTYDSNTENIYRKIASALGTDDIEYVKKNYLINKKVYTPKPGDDIYYEKSRNELNSEPNIEGRKKLLALIKIPEGLMATEDNYPGATPKQRALRNEQILSVMKNAVQRAFLDYDGAFGTNNSNRAGAYFIRRQDSEKFNMDVANATATRISSLPGAREIALRIQEIPDSALSANTEFNQRRNIELNNTPKSVEATMRTLNELQHGKDGEIGTRGKITLIIDQINQELKLLSPNQARIQQLNVDLKKQTDIAKAQIRTAQKEVGAVNDNILKTYGNSNAKISTLLVDLSKSLTEIENDYKVTSKSISSALGAATVVENNNKIANQNQILTKANILPIDVAKTVNSYNQYIVSSEDKITQAQNVLTAKQAAFSLLPSKENLEAVKSANKKVVDMLVAQRETVNKYVGTINEQIAKAPPPVNSKSIEQRTLMIAYGNNIQTKITQSNAVITNATQQLADTNKAAYANWNSLLSARNAEIAAPFNQTGLESDKNKILIPPAETKQGGFLTPEQRLHIAYNDPANQMFLHPSPQVIAGAAANGVTLINYKSEAEFIAINKPGLSYARNLEPQASVQPFMPNVDQAIKGSQGADSIITLSNQPLPNQPPLVNASGFTTQNIDPPVTLPSPNPTNPNLQPTNGQAAYDSDSTLMPITPTATPEQPRIQKMGF